MSGSSVFTSKISDEVVGGSSGSIINGSLIAYQINIKFGSICIYIYTYIYMCTAYIRNNTQNYARTFHFIPANIYAN